MDLTQSKILTIEQQPIVRQGIVAVLSPIMAGMEVLGSDSFSDALLCIENNPIRLVICNFLIHGDTALSFLQKIKPTQHKTRCLILSALDEIQVGYPCIRAGASGFIRKSSPVGQVVDAAQTILAGRHYVSERLSQALMQGCDSRLKSSAAARLTTRELQVFTLIGEGLTVSQIAAKLGVSVKTVEAHRENIKNKLGWQNASQVTAAAVRWLDDTSVTI